jgi:cell division septum initiation protein DivIVA
MPKNEFKAMEKHVKELEALKHYRKVKQERDSLSVEATRLRERVAQLEEQLKSEISTKNELSSRLSKSEAEVKELSSRLDEAQKELSSLQEFKVKLPEGNGLTLNEMRIQFLGAQEDEIERRAKERFRELEKDIRSRMPALVRKRLTEVLRSSKWPSEVEDVIDSKAKQVADGILADREKWPDWFKAQYLDQLKESVSMGLDSEFERRAQQEAERRLDALKAGQWREYAAGKARALAAGVKDMLRELQGPWGFTCDRCTSRIALEIGPSDIGSLLRGETIDVTCAACSDPAPFPFFLSTVPHRVGSITLEKLLQFYMGNAPPHDKAE